MSMLHTVNKSPFERNSLQSCIEHAKEGSTILMIEDGIYGALKGTENSDMVNKAMASLKVCVLGADLSARGIGEDKVIDGITIVDYSGFVDLVSDHDTNQTWL
jgi:tRNA 2-thiouridine synthesizing protein B